LSFRGRLGVSRGFRDDQEPESGGAVSLLRRVLDDLRRGENIDAYVTVLAAVALSVLNIAGVLPASSLSGVILGVLALLAVGTLVTRARLEAMASGADRARLPEFPVRYGPDYQAAVDTDGDLWLQGVSLTRTITGSVFALERRLRLGHVVRVLLIQPDSRAAQLAEDRLGVPADYQRRRFQTESSLGHLANLAEQAGGRLEVRLTEQELGFGATVIRAGTSRAVIYVEYYAYRGIRDGLPLVITPADGRWYDFHLGQIEALWEDATAWQPSNPNTPTATA
jgi:hypothetical protein